PSHARFHEDPAASAGDAVEIPEDPGRPPAGHCYGDRWWGPRELRSEWNRADPSREARSVRDQPGGPGNARGPHRRRPGRRAEEGPGSGASRDGQADWRTESAV